MQGSRGTRCTNRHTKQPVRTLGAHFLLLEAAPDSSLAEVLIRRISPRKSLTRETGRIASTWGCTGRSCLRWFARASMSFAHGRETAASNISHSSREVFAAFITAFQSISIMYPSLSKLEAEEDRGRFHFSYFYKPHTASALRCGRLSCKAGQAQWLALVQGPWLFTLARYLWVAVLYVSATLSFRAFYPVQWSL